jgi:hypothetical protein
MVTYGIIVKFKLVINPTSLSAGEKVLAVSEEELLEMFEGRDLNVIVNAIENIKNIPELRMIYDRQNLYFGELVMANGEKILILTEDNGLLRNVSPGVKAVKIPIDVYRQIFSTAHPVDIPYLVKTNYLNSDEITFFKIVPVIFNHGVVDIITEDNFGKYERMFEISEVIPDEYGKISFIYVNGTVAVSIITHATTLSQLQRETLEVKLPKLATKLSILYSSMDSSPENVMNMFVDFIYSSKRILNTILRRPFLLLMRFMPNEYLEIRDLIIQKAISIHPNVLSEVITNYVENYNMIKPISPEAVVVKMLNIHPQGREILKNNGFRSNWIVISTKKENSFEELIYRDSIIT